MSLLIAAVIGLVLGYTSHMRQSVWRRVQGVIEGLAIVSAANWIFYNLGIWWWLSILLAIIVYALYLLLIQALVRKKVRVETSATVNV